MKRKNIDRELMVLPVFDTVIMPHMATRLLVEPRYGEKLAELIRNDHPFAVTLTVKEGSDENDLNENSFYKTGALVYLESVQRSEKGFLVNIKSLDRIKVEEFKQNETVFNAIYNFENSDMDLDEKSQKSMNEYILTIVREISENFQGSEQFVKEVEQFDSTDEIIGYIMPYVSASIAEKQELLEMDSAKAKSLRFIDMLNKQKESIELQIEMAQKFNKRVNKSHREAILREQMKAIQEELNENTNEGKNKKDYNKLIDDAEMPEDVKDVALEELRKLESMGPQHHEAALIRNYLDLMVALPWKSGEQIDIDLEEARKVLDNEHYGLDKVKERIIQHLAVMSLKKEKKGSILLLVGPPGTGKTSLGKSIAEALSRQYVRISLGGIKDEAEIRGHRRTYVGALPGRIIQGMKKAGEKNPVFVLDEVDKLMASFNGDPASALLEVLDPEQNNTFADHYLEVPYDLSEVFFIATANTISSIPRPLLDRMEVIQISSYTNNEKFVIGEKHLLSETLEEHGLTEKQLQIEDDAMHHIIEKYTREAGVRGLKKQLSKIARVASEKIVSGKVKLPYVVKVDMLNEILGKAVIRLDEALTANGPGVVTGLAWTPVGGDILFIEGTFMPGKGELILTGQLGNVMKESARISLSLIRARLAHLIGHFDFSKNDIHIHVPSGAIPKDGPSAGITIFTTLASLLLGRSVDNKIAMTGEITLRGTVLPVGGIKEKIIAAHRAGIKKIILSKENEEDLKDVPEEVQKELSFKLVETIEEVVKETLNVDLPQPGFLNRNSKKDVVIPKLEIEN